MGCSNNTSTSGGCGCGSSTSSSAVAAPCAPPCASAVAGNCVEYMNAACTVMNDSIKEYGIQKGDTVESVLQRLILAITNPACVTLNFAYSPIALQSTNITNSTITVAWGASDDNPSGTPVYEVQYKLNDPGIPTWTLLPQQNTNTVTITGLLSMNSYEIRVLPVFPNGNNSSCYSVTIIVTTL